MQHQPIPLLERLRHAADHWSGATGRTLGALSALVTNNGSFFDRLGESRASTTTATLEKFARFLVEPANWPEGEVPADVVKFAHDVGVSAAAAAASPDDSAAAIGGNGSSSEAASGVSGPASPSGRTPGADGIVRGAASPDAEADPLPLSRAAPGDLFAGAAAGGA